jgi:cytoskeletal protein RodZ
VAEAAMGIGGELRAARRARKRSIEDISGTTKIAPSILRAIENDRFDETPGGLFTRGFLRAYAREVGLDGEDLVRRYRAEVEPAAVTTATSTSDPAASPIDDRAADLDDPAAAATHAQIIQLAVILLVVGVGYLALRPAKPPVLVDAPIETAVPAAADAAPIATTGSTTPVATTGSTAPVPTDGPTTTVAKSLTVDIHPTGPCWVDGTADGQHVVGRLMDAGGRETIEVKENLTLRVGDPAAFAFSIDGVAGRSLGRPGVAATIRIDRANYESFLAPRPSSESARAVLTPE